METRKELEGERCRISRRFTIRSVRQDFRLCKRTKRFADKRYTAIESPLDANVWKVHVAEHDVLDEEQTVCVLEAMKMEVNVNIPKHLGKVVVQKVNTVQGTTVRAGHNLFVVRTID